MNHWLYPANPKFYDVFSALAEAETYWPMNSKVEEGDRIYFYLAAQHKQIGFISDVVETGLKQADVIGQLTPYMKGKADKGEENASKPFMKIRHTAAVPVTDESVFGLSQLRSNGLNGMLMGPRKLENNLTLLDYIKGLESELS